MTPFSFYLKPIKPIVLYFIQFYFNCRFFCTKDAGIEPGSIPGLLKGLKIRAVDFCGHCIDSPTLLQLG